MLFLLRISLKSIWLPTLFWIQMNFADAQRLQPHWNPSCVVHRWEKQQSWFSQSLCEQEVLFSQNQWPRGSALWLLCFCLPRNYAFLWTCQQWATWFAASISSPWGLKQQIFKLHIHARVTAVHLELCNQRKRRKGKHLQVLPFHTSSSICFSNCSCSLE